MLYTYFNGKLLRLQGVIVTKIEKIDGKNHIYVELEHKEQRCPCWWQNKHCSRLQKPKRILSNS